MDNQQHDEKPAQRSFSVVAQPGSMLELFSLVLEFKVSLLEVELSHFSVKLQFCFVFFEFQFHSAHLHFVPGCVLWSRLLGALLANCRCRDEHCH
jgi:hypothetical protein